VIPTAYHAANHLTSSVERSFAAPMNDELILTSNLGGKAQRGLSTISRGTAILLLGVYVAYLIFQLKTHASFFVTRKRRWILFDDDGARARMSMIAAGLG
jgi:Ca2+/H+ antiporter